MSARKMIRLGMDVNRSDSDGRTPLHIVSSEGNYETVKLLLQHGANLNAKDRWERHRMIMLLKVDILISML
jgi:ankyrin repeat protein